MGEGAAGEPTASSCELVRAPAPPGAGEKPAETVLVDLGLAGQVALLVQQRAARQAATEGEAGVGWVEMGGAGLLVAALQEAGAGASQRVPVMLHDGSGVDGAAAR